ncbi:MAG: aspartyl/asparaginyl beta-hydroxylase domain-containing protein [Phycisphaerales bacterium JB059]
MPPPTAIDRPTAPAPEAPVEVHATGPNPEPLSTPKRKTSTSRLVKRIVKRVLGVGAIIALAVVGWTQGWYAVPIIIGLFVLCGVLDVLRHRPLWLWQVDSYFFGKGVLTWVLAPFNLLMDLISLPYWNKIIYQLDDLPKLHQDEITRVLDAAKEADLIAQLEDKITDGRSMIFFKWYGKDLPVSVDVPAFHEQYKTIRTIGVSVFNKRKSTSWHFGPLRATFRVLYNLRPTPDNAAFIQVGDRVHHWNDQPLFIFDDTIMHQSCNESDHARYCMFIDIVRPNKIPAVMNVIVHGLQFLLIRINRSFYKRWAMIK